MTRFYALLANGGNLVTPHLLDGRREPERLGASPCRRWPAPKHVGIDPAALKVVDSRPLGGDASPVRDLVRRCSASSRCRSRARPAPREKVVSLPGYIGLQNQSWWCGYGPYDSPKLVVCALIENGGHGGDAAAPAAAKVFAAYFHVKYHIVGPIHSD